jgi:hypothetical protein
MINKIALPRQRACAIRPMPLYTSTDTPESMTSQRPVTPEVPACGGGKRGESLRVFSKASRRGWVLEALNGRGSVDNTGTKAVS